MTITVQEKHEGTSGSAGGWKYDYLVTDDSGTMTEFEAANAVALEAPNPLSDGGGGILVLADINVGSFMESPSVTRAIVTASYGVPEEGSRLGRDGTSPTGGVEATYEFSYQAPSEHISLALQTLKYPSTAPSFGNRIKCRYDGPDLVCEGLDLPSGNTTNVWRLNVPRGYVTAEYEALVESMVGSVNYTTFKGRPPGTMRFVQVQSTLTRSSSMSISWGFQYSPNIGDVTVNYGSPIGNVRYNSGLPAQTIDGLTNIKKPGHWLLWNLDEKKLDITNQKMVMQARAIYVQEVFPVADFNQLGF